MDPKVAYWTAALLNMMIVVGSALAGVRRARQRDFVGHRRRMLLSIWLVVAFLVSFALKSSILGPERLDTWSALDRGILWTHELCVSVMLVAGLTALFQARRLDLPRGPASRPIPAQRLVRGVRVHRLAGRTAVIASLAGLVTAAGVLLGMYQRIGWL